MKLRVYKIQHMVYITAVSEAGEIMLDAISKVTLELGGAVKVELGVNLGDLKNGQEVVLNI